MKCTHTYITATILTLRPQRPLGTINNEKNPRSFVNKRSSPPIKAWKLPCSFRGTMMEKNLSGVKAYVRFIVSTSIIGTGNISKGEYTARLTSCKHFHNTYCQCRKLRNLCSPNILTLFFCSHNLNYLLVLIRGLNIFATGDWRN